MHRTPLFSLCAAVLGGIPALPAQGGLAWPGAASAPATAYVLRVGANDYDVYVPGWLTVGTPSTFADEFVGAGFGLATGTVREVDVTEFENEETGAAAELAPLFPFQKNANVQSQVQTRHPSLLWTGFLTKAGRDVDGFHGGALVFRFRPNFGVDPAAFFAQVDGGMVVVGVADKDGKLATGSRLFQLDLVAGPAELMYWKFDRQVGDFALNYADGYAGAPRRGRLAGSVPPWTSGVSKGGLRGGTATAHAGCDTGWRLGLRGELTVAWSMRQRTAPGASASRFFGGPGGLACFTGGAAGKGIQLDGWSGSAAGLQLAVDVQTRAATQWVHVALVLFTDAGSNKRFQWFVDGVAQTGGVRNGDADLPLAAGSLSLGGTSTAPNLYDLDEFRLWGAAVPQATVQAWAKGPSPATASHGNANGCALRSSGKPALGGSFVLQVLGAPLAKAGIVVGAPAAVPFSLAGQTVFVDPVAVHVLARTDAQGRLTLPIAVPNDPLLRGVLAYSQAYLAVGTELLISNAHAASIE